MSLLTWRLRDACGEVTECGKLRLGAGSSATVLFGRCYGILSRLSSRLGLIVLMSILNIWKKFNILVEQLVRWLPKSAIEANQLVMYLGQARMVVRFPFEVKWLFVPS